MSEHEMKELLKKSSHKPPAADQNAPTTAEGSHNDVARLQRLVGNRALQRMLADNSVSINQRTGTTIQAKMTVGAADDAYEREADAVADRVMTKRDVVQRAPEEEELQMMRVQRAAEEEEEPLQMQRIQRAPEEEELQMMRVQRAAEEEELQMQRIQRAPEEEEPLQMQRIQRKDDEMPADKSGSFDASSDIESRISAKSGSGQSIPDVNRELFESSMGRDFSGVNVHTDAESNSLNKELGARAFTTGSDIFFRSGEYNPGSSDGQRLLAHELTHVVQQGGAGVKKKPQEE
ncbi:MAG: DUF4157 domain-containing protein [Anaerolineae bacterium]|nr:DUF4157 domain-containing protein [Anaerolineae bacterium]